MTDRGKFLIYVIEIYRSAKNMSGKEVAELFSRYDVWDYVYSCFEALHTTGEKYIINDIDGFIAESE